jgi:membrane-associated phospholipid phosphatase
MRVAAVPALAIALVAVPARAASDARMPSPIDALGADIVRSFSGWNLAYFGGAVAATAVLAPTGVDHAVRLGVQEHAYSRAWGDAAYYTGYILPTVVAPGLYVAGLLAPRRSLAGAGSAAVQALALTVGTTFVLKVATGRPYPRNAGPPGALDQPSFAREFSPFGFGGRYAWPSGHTSAAVSVAAALSAYSRELAVGLVAYPIALGIGTGMILGDHHWTSDVVAGALIGQAFGWSVGDAFREREHDVQRPHIQLVPLLTPGMQGCAVIGVL